MTTSKLQKIKDYIENSYGDAVGQSAALDLLAELESNWQIVPKTATDEMEEAAGTEAGSPSDWYGFDAMYQAALKVSPTF